MMGREEARLWAIGILNNLSSHFKVNPPRFRYNRTGSHGIYYSGRQEVTTAVPESYRHGRTMEHSLLHEFAHHLADERLREIRRVEQACGVEWFNRTKEHAHHGNEFKKALLEVTTHYYSGAPKKYAWITEYKSIQAWARNRGLLPPRPAPLTQRYGSGIMTFVDRQGSGQIYMPLGAGAFAVSDVIVTHARKRNFPPFDKVACCNMKRNGARHGEIAKALSGGRALGHTGNLVRKTLSEAGLL